MQPNIFAFGSANLSLLNNTSLKCGGKAGVCQYCIQQLDTQRMPHPDEASSARLLSVEEPQFLENAPRNWEYESEETLDDSFEQKPTRQELVQENQQLKELLRQVLSQMGKMRQQNIQLKEQLRTQEKEIQELKEKLKNKEEKVDEQEKVEGMKVQEKEKRFEDYGACIRFRANQVPEVAQNFPRNQQGFTFGHFLDCLTENEEKQQQEKPPTEKSPDSLKYTSEEPSQINFSFRDTERQNYKNDD